MMTLYVVTNIINGKQYVGQTTWPLAERWAQHIRDARTLRKRYALHGAIRKHGADSFAVLEIPQPAWFTQADLDAAECRFIAALSTVRPGGYNIAGGGKGGRLHPDTKAKIGAANRGRKRTAEQRAVIRAHLIGRRATDAQREKMRAAMTGRHPTPETRAKLSASAKRRGPHRLSDETRAIVSAKLSALAKRRWAARRLPLTLIGNKT